MSCVTPPFWDIRGYVNLSLEKLKIIHKISNLAIDTRYRIKPIISFHIHIY